MLFSETHTCSMECLTIVTETIQPRSIVNEKDFTSLLTHTGRDMNCFDGDSDLRKYNTVQRREAVKQQQQQQN